MQSPLSAVHFQHNTRSSMQSPSLVIDDNFCTNNNVCYFGDTVCQMSVNGVQVEC